VAQGAGQSRASRARTRSTTTAATAPTAAKGKEAQPGSQPRQPDVNEKGQQRDEDDNNVDHGVCEDGPRDTRPDTVTAAKDHVGIPLTGHVPDTRCLLPQEKNRSSTAGQDTLSHSPRRLRSASGTQRAKDQPSILDAFARPPANAVSTEKSQDNTGTD